MLANVDDLRDFSGLEPAPAAAYAIADDACAMCHARPLPANASLNATLSWLEANAPEEAARVRTGSGGSADVPIAWKEERQRIAADSRVEPGYALPIGFLQIACSQMDGDLDDFVPDAFLVAICGNCAAQTYPAESIVARLREIYIAKHADGNEAAAMRQPSWQLADRFLDLVATIARSHRGAA